MVKKMNGVIALLLCFVISFGLAGCDHSEKSKKTKPKEPNSSSAESGSSSTDSKSDLTNEFSKEEYTLKWVEDSSSYGTDREIILPGENGTEENTRIGEHNIPFKSNTVNMKITADYKIIYAEKDTKAKEYAQMLKEYYSDKHNLNLSVESDKSPAISKELLVGNTNRRTVNMKENEYSVRTSGLKVIFSGGHTAMLEKAVQTFIRLGYTDGKVHTFVNSTDFVSSRFGYTYVWGDEFDSYTLDTNKWCREAKMSGYTDLDITTSPEYANTDNGYLKLFAKRYYNSKNKNIVAAVPYSICTKNTMSFRYGYFEMRARLPFMQGAWPSLWAVSNDALGSEECSKKHRYLIEVDMLEVFSSTDTLMSNIHKWFTDGTERHTMWPQDDMRRGYTFAGGNLINEYHTYGCEWTPNEISMYVDGKKFFTFDITKDFDNEGAGMEGFRENQLFLIFNNHIFTENAEMNEDGSKTVDLNTLPIEYDIDWIRLYQKNDGLSNRYEKKGSNVIKYAGNSSEIYK